MSAPVAEVKISKKTFLTAVIILGALMLLVGVLTLIIPSGSYDRVLSEGREVIKPESFHFVQPPEYPVWRWLTAPFEVLAGPDAAMVIVIIVFILAIGGAFSLLEKSGVMAAVMSKIVNRFGNRKYLLLSIIVMFFMLMGAVLGTFEENIALVPLVITLAYYLGWDSLTGLGMSVLASCFGFSAAISNPFSVAITQKIAGLPLYSAMGYRIIIFVVFYIMLCIFLIHHAKKVERDPKLSPVYEEDLPLRENQRKDQLSGNGSAALEVGIEAGTDTKKLDKAITCFSFFLMLILAAILAASFVEGLSDLVMPIIGIVFLVGSIFSSILSGTGFKKSLSALANGVSGMAPGIILILMAMSVKFIISKGGIMDTILYYASSVISQMSPFLAIFLVYFLVLILELFIGSSSAKAFLIMPLIAPLSDLVGITRQSSVLAFCFGDGFSNVLYPTNPVLLICLGLTVVSYPKWLKWTIKLQLVVFGISCVFLAIAVAIKLGPF